MVADLDGHLVQQTCSVQRAAQPVVSRFRAARPGRARVIDLDRPGESRADDLNVIDQNRCAIRFKRLRHHASLWTACIMRNRGCPKNW